MRLYDETNQNILDTSHFRYIMLDGSSIRLYNEKQDEGGKFAPAYSIPFPSPEEAKEKFDELSEEPGWYSINRGKIPHLVNTFGFRRFYAVESEDGRGYIYFFNSENDYLKIGCQSYKDACESLKSLIL